MNFVRKMAALKSSFCRFLSRNPARLLAVSGPSLQKISIRRRLLNTTSSLFDSDRVIITESCSNQLEKILEKGQFLRILIEGGGCSGFQYKFQVDNQLEEDDRVFGEGKARVVVDEGSLQLVDGSSIDYEVEMIKSGFVVKKNPNADKGCSCGSSFSVKI